MPWEVDPYELPDRLYGYLPPCGFTHVSTSTRPGMKGKGDSDCHYPSFLPAGLQRLAICHTEAHSSLLKTAAFISFPALWYHAILCDFLQLYPYFAKRAFVEHSFNYPVGMWTIFLPGLDDTCM
jgi:hypothetical protein